MKYIEKSILRKKLIKLMYTNSKGNSTLTPKNNLSRIKNHNSFTTDTDFRTLQKIRRPNRTIQGTSKCKASLSQGTGLPELPKAALLTT